MKRETICLIIACLISFILTAGIMNWRMEIVHAELSDTQQSLAKEVFRFHVIAESDSANDQRIKLKVRDAVAFPVNLVIVFRIPHFRNFFAGKQDDPGLPN